MVGDILDAARDAPLPPSALAPRQHRPAREGGHVDVRQRLHGRRDRGHRVEDPAGVLRQACPGRAKLGGALWNSELT